MSKKFDSPIYPSDILRCYGQGYIYVYTTYLTTMNIRIFELLCTEYNPQEKKKKKNRKKEEILPKMNILILERSQQHKTGFTDLTIDSFRNQR